MLSFVSLQNEWHVSERRLLCRFLYHPFSINSGREKTLSALLILSIQLAATFTNILCLSSFWADPVATAHLLTGLALHELAVPS